MSLLEMRGVCRTFSRGPEVVEALREVDLDVEPGRIVAVVGASGSGKTTLLNIAGGLDRPTSGSVRLKGLSLATLAEASLTEARRRHVGVVFQDFCLMPGLTVVENVRLPLMFSGRSDGGDRAVEILERLGMGARLRFRPHQLSGGEQQRVAIARALINAPALLLADEPTGNLDSEQAAAIFDLFRGLAVSDGVGLLMATHNLELARRADLVVRLRDGLVERGV